MRVPETREEVLEAANLVLSKTVEKILGDVNEIADAVAAGWLREVESGYYSSISREELERVDRVVVQEVLSQRLADVLFSVLPSVSIGPRWTDWSEWSEIF